MSNTLSITSFPFAVVTWLKYCRYGIKLFTVNPVLLNDVPHRRDRSQRICFLKNKENIKEALDYFCIHLAFTINLTSEMNAIICKIKKILRYIHTLISNCKTNLQVCIFFLPVVNVGKCVQLTTIECKLDRFFKISIQTKKSSFHLNLILYNFLFKISLQIPF